MQGWIILLVGVVFVGAVALFLDPGVGFFMAAILLPLIVIEFVIQSKYVRVLRACVERYQTLIGRVRRRA